MYDLIYQHLSCQNTQNKLFYVFQLNSHTDTYYDEKDKGIWCCVVIVVIQFGQEMLSCEIYGKSVVTNLVLR